MEYFVDKNSIVREIWGRPDTVLFIFAGSAGEFALNKAVDWLYYTGRLPADPLGRLFSTVTYSRLIIFSPLDEANRFIDQISQIHQTVEHNRRAQIPDWAYRDVLFMLIWYSIASYEALYRPLTDAEKAEVFDVFIRVGKRMQLSELPVTYRQWQQMHAEHIENDTIRSHFTYDLYIQYRKHLGGIRFYLLKKVQALIVPEPLKAMLRLKNPGLLFPLLRLYKFVRIWGLDRLLIENMLPAKYRIQIKQINVDNR